MDGENNGTPKKKWDDLGGKPTIFGKTHMGNMGGGVSPTLFAITTFFPPPKKNKNPKTIPSPSLKAQLQLFFCHFWEATTIERQHIKNMNQTQPTFTKVHYKSIYTTIPLMVQKSQATTRDVQLNLVNNCLFTTNLNWWVLPGLPSTAMRLASIITAFGESGLNDCSQKTCGFDIFPISLTQRISKILTAENGGFPLLKALEVDK